MENIPKLRYKGFCENTSLIKLEDCFELVTSKNKNLEESLVLTNSAVHGITSQEKFFDTAKIVSKENLDKYTTIDLGYFVYNPRKSIIAPYGPINLNEYAKGIISPLYLCFKVKDSYKNQIDKKYIQQFFQSSNWHKYVYANGDTGTRHDRVSISNKTFMKMPIELISMEEQRKIVTLLEKINFLINEKEKEIEYINTIRKHQLKKTFHANLCKSKMHDIMILKNGRDYKHCSNGNIPVYGTGGLMTTINQSLSDVDAVGIGRKGTIDKPFILSAPFWTVDTLFYAIPKKVSLYYLYLQFQSINWKLYNEGSTLPSLTSKSINNVKIHLHSQNEINHISNLFEYFDNLILNYNSELNNHLKIKSVLLSKLLA